MTGVRGHGALPLVLDGASLRAGEVEILTRISTRLAPGRPTVIIGPNGSGKTSLLRLCAGLVAPTEGRIRWGDEGTPPRARLAILFQRPVMLRRSVADNVLYGLVRHGLRRGERIARMQAALDQVGLAHLARRPARRLSGGEQQRVALARALVRAPDVLLLDEPTASLDPAATRAVERIITCAAGSGIKVVMTSHDLGQARRLADEVLFLARGRLFERAPATTFFDRPATSEAAAFIRGDLVI